MAKKETRKPVGLRMRPSLYLAIQYAALAAGLSAAEWIERITLPAIPVAFRKGIK